MALTHSQGLTSSIKASLCESLCGRFSFQKSNVQRFAVRRVNGTIRAQVGEEKYRKERMALLAVASIPSVSALSAAAAPTAQAVSASDVDAEAIASILSKVELLSQKISAAAVDTYSSAGDALKQLVETTKPAVDVATPLVQTAAQQVAEAAAPVASDLFEQSVQFLEDSGLDTKSLVDFAKAATSVAGSVTEQTVDVVSPYALTTTETVLSQSPEVLAAGAAALLAVYFLAPPLVFIISSIARGYAGELAAAETLDLLTKEELTLVDIRPDSQVVRSGVPSLPKNVKRKYISIPLEEVSRPLRGQLKAVRLVEAEITAVKIASLKRLGKNSKIAIIDSNGDIAKAVAKSLAGLGFSYAYVVKGGTDGDEGWKQSQLALDTVLVVSPPRTEVVAPSRVIRAGSSRLPPPKPTRMAPKSGSSAIDVGRRSSSLLLPGGSDSGK